MPGTGTQAFWIDATRVGTQEHYGEHLRTWRHAFAAGAGEPAAEGVTLDPLHFALGAWEVANRPVADPPYVRRHPRVLDATCHRPEEAPGMLAVVELAAPAPTTLELRVPLPVDRLPTPTRARASGLPNLDDAQAALEALVDELNAVVTPFLRELEASR
jgi:hypothetical protein